MSYTIFVREDGTTFNWKDCEVLGCPNQICVPMSSKFCYPHALRGGCEPPAKVAIPEHTESS